MSKLARSAAVAAVAVALSPAAATAQQMTLMDVLETTIDTSPDLRVQRFTLRGLDESVASARSGKRPTITGSASTGGTYSNNSEQGPNVERLQFPSTVSVAVSQSIYDGGQTRNAVREALSNVESGRFDLLSSQQSVLLQSVGAYVDVIQAQQNVEIAEKSVAVIAEQLEAANARFEVGEVTRTDVAQAEAALAEARANLATQQGLLGQARAAFIRDVGVAPDRLAPLDTLPIDLPGTLDEGLEIAGSSHPDILAAQASVKAASFNVRQAIGATLPQLDFNTSVSVSNGTIGRDSEALSHSFSLNGSVPFYVGGSLRASIRAAQASAAAERARLGVTTRVILEQVGIAWANFVSSQATLKATVAQREAEQVAFEGVREEAKVGARTTLEVLEAEEDLLEARLAVVSSAASVQLNAYSLLSAVGKLTVESRRLAVAEPYDPQPLFESSQGLLRGYDDTEDTEWLGNFRP